MKKKKLMKQKAVLGVGWYREDQWDLLLSTAVDKDDLEPTYAEWLDGATKGIEKLSNSDFQCVKIPIDVEEMNTWFKENGHPFAGESRVLYITMKTKEKFS